MSLPKNFKYAHIVFKNEKYVLEAIHKRPWQLGGVKNWSELPMDRTKNPVNMGERGVKNPK